SENEWYKAAYYDPSTSGYFDYPAGSNLQTACTTATASPNSANCDFAYPGGYFTPVGSYSGSASPYGTFDQGGNAEEWNETVVTGSARGIRGGSYYYSRPALAAAARGAADGTTYYSETTGFRLAMIPEPGTGLLMGIGLLGFARWRKARD